MGFYYMAVSSDIYELPLTPPMSCTELARRLGISVNYLRWMCNPSVMARNKHINKPSRPWRVVRVQIQEE